MKNLYNLIEFLRYRLSNSSRSFTDLMTAGKSEEWALFFKSHKEELQYQTSAMLVKVLEEGNMTAEEQKGFRAGLKALPALWLACYEEWKREEILKTKQNEESLRLEKLKSYRSKLV